MYDYHHSGSCVFFFTSVYSSPPYGGCHWQQQLLMLRSLLYSSLVKAIEGSDGWMDGWVTLLLVHSLVVVVVASFPG